MSKQTIAAFALFAALFLGIGTNARAGDSASFVDLGFSADGGVYMFAQYGVAADTLKPWAELYVVDVPRNDFVRGGVKKSSGSAAADPGQDGSGLFHELLADNAAIAKKYAVDHTRQGTPLFLALENGGAVESPIEFRDFDSGASYAVKLSQFAEGTGAAVRSSFFLSVERTDKAGKKKSYTVGAPSRKRAGVASYAIRRVVSAPRDGSLVFVIEMKKNGPKGVDIRYMVEALRLY